MNSLRDFEFRLPALGSIFFHGLTILGLLFFGFSHILFESFWVGVGCFVTLLIAVFSLISVVNQNQSPMLLLGFVISLAVTLALTSYLFGDRGLIYCFPLTGALFFLIRFQLAVVLGLIIIAVCAIAALNSMDAILVARFVLAMCFSFFFSGNLAYQIYKQQMQLEQDANQDYLTGLMNQRSFYAWLDQYLCSSRSAEGKMTLFYFDIDNFKSINDSFGHAGGDLVLKEFSVRILDATKKIYAESGVDDEIHFCRLSGDEFVLACPHATNKDMVANTATKFHESLSKPFAIGGRMTLIRSSIGVHYFSVENQTLAEVMQLADDAMYSAKKMGEQQFYISEENRDRRIDEAESLY